MCIKERIHPLKSEPFASKSSSPLHSHSSTNQPQFPRIHSTAVSKKDTHYFHSHRTVQSRQCNHLEHRRSGTGVPSNVTHSKELRTRPTKTRSLQNQA
ncbi:hypothetical protein M758_1G044700 [Ceratodon purpureus]|nr:hypothetical protein M758_1G044700 [Ceratodon purpureus]